MKKLLLLLSLLLTNVAYAGQNVTGDLTVTGNVGVATSLPSALVHIVQTGFPYALRVDDSATDNDYFFIDRNGNVGIGTNLAVTTSKLFLNGTTQIMGNVGIGTQANPSINHANIEIIGNGSQEPLRVNDAGINDTTPVVITSNGNLGIGTTSAPDKFNMLGVRFNAYAGNVSNGAVQLANQSYDLLIGNSLSSGAYFRFLPYLGDIYFENFTPGSVPASGNLIFRHTMNSGDGAQEDMRIDVNGNMGIGLGGFGPKALLEINTTAAQDVFRADDNGPTGDSSPFVINSDGNVGIGTTTAFGGKLIVSVATGNVGIGSITPGKTLDVQGNIRATGYYSGDNTQGISATCGTTSVTSITIKNGLITACTGI